MARPQISLASVPQMARRNRSPEHVFQLRHRPYQIQPFLIAPVLPGETLKNGLMQARVVTDPIKNPLIGWHVEYYFFYVKHRDMPNSATWQTMVMQADYDTSARNVAAKVEHYHYATSIDWVAECLEPVTNHYFRGFGETMATASIGNLPAAAINRDSWMDSLIDETLLPEGGDPQTTPDGAEDLNRLMLMYEHLRAMKLYEGTYEDWLKSYGVRPAAVEVPGKPELIRYVKDWSYPSNTVDPTSGTPSSAVSWAVQERFDKDRFFKEPGFIFGVTIARPKVYFGKQKGYAASMMNDAFSWLPAVLRDQAAVSLKEFAAAAGPLQGNTTNGYWVDVRDLFIYGDQFVNFALTETDAGLMALPTTALQKRYPSSADVDALFKSASPANQVRQDGVCRLTVASQDAAVDYT